MTRRTTARTVLLALVVAATVVAAVVGWTLSEAIPSPSSPTSFGWLTSTPPVSGGTRVASQTGLGTLAVPPGFRPVRGDRGTLSLAMVDAAGDYLGYLNVTPRQGDETLRGWAAFRLSHLLDDDAGSTHEIAAAEGIRTESGIRSCVIDDYVTKVDHHHFREVACFVVDGSSSSVIVAAAPAADPAHVWHQLEGALATYPVN